MSKLVANIEEIEGNIEKITSSLLILESKMDIFNNSLIYQKRTDITNYINQIKTESKNITTTITNWKELINNSTQIFENIESGNFYSFPDNENEEIVALREEQYSNDTIITPTLTLTFASSTSLETELPSYESIMGVAMEVPSVGRSVKKFEGYKSFYNSSLQYQLQTECYTDNEGFRIYKDESGIEYYTVALGSYYTADRIGKKFRITLSTGESIYVITGDQKADEHTDTKHQYCNVTSNYDILEFIVDTSKLDSAAKTTGDCSTTASGKFEGDIEAIYYLGDIYE